MEKNILDKLSCPACSAAGRQRGRLFETPPDGSGNRGDLRCEKCGTEFMQGGGIIDFVGDASSPRIFSSQWSMEFPPIIALYEHIWRPAVTRPFSDLSWEIDTSLRLMDLAPEHDVLDIACGPGNFTRLFAGKLGRGSVIGIDLSLPMLKRGIAEIERIKNRRITLMRVDVTKWVFAPKSFDRVHCAGALHLFPSLPSVFRSIYDSLRPGGIFIGATYLKAAGRTKRLFQNYISSAHGFHWFEPEELQGLVSGAGFTGWEQYVKKQGVVFRAKK
ncbi:MAG: class I SAM-dependent methyltransferase [Spirochaetes bacterium]|nr:class I SAM-dependent methyltransferase [Spirochaetota bacterium]